MTAKTGYEKGITLQKGFMQGIYGAISYGLTYAVVVFDVMPESAMTPGVICVMAICRAFHNYLKHRKA